MLHRIQSNSRQIFTTKGTSTINSKSSANKKRKHFLPNDFQPRSTDVIVGRGNKCKYHKGNKLLQSIIISRLEQYSKALTKREKSQILDRIITEIRSGNPNGMFIKQDSATQLWYEVGNFLAKEKISQAFRDALSGSYRSCNDFKKKRRRERNTKDNIVHSIKRARPHQVTSSTDESTTFSCWESLDNARSQVKACQNKTDGLSQCIVLSAYSDLFEPNSISEMATKKRNVSDSIRTSDCFANKKDFNQSNIEFPDELEELDTSGLLLHDVEAKHNNLSKSNMDCPCFGFGQEISIHLAMKV